MAPLAAPAPAAGRGRAARLPRGSAPPSRQSCRASRRCAPPRRRRRRRRPPRAPARLKVRPAQGWALHAALVCRICLAGCFGLEALESERDCSQPFAPRQALSLPSCLPPRPAVCNERQQFNSSTGRCDCLPGWGGPGCDACQSDAVCASYFGASGATCSDELAFQQGMQFKAYTCDLTVGAAAAGCCCRLVPLAAAAGCCCWLLLRDACPPCLRRARTSNEDCLRCIAQSIGFYCRPALPPAHRQSGAVWIAARYIMVYSLCMGHCHACLHVQTTPACACSHPVACLPACLRRTLA